MRDSGVMMSSPECRVSPGAAFRMPDIMAQAGADTGPAMTIHTSNDRIGGYTEGVGAPDRAGLARQATPKLYRDPDRLAHDLPTLRSLSRPQREIAAPASAVSAGPCRSQIGSGALPVDTIPGAGLAVRPVGRRGDDALSGLSRIDPRKAAHPSHRKRQDVVGEPTTSCSGRLAPALRAPPRPVIGRVPEGAPVLDLRCLDDEAGFAADLLSLPRGADVLA